MNVGLNHALVHEQDAWTCKEEGGQRNESARQIDKGHTYRLRDERIDLWPVIVFDLALDDLNLVLQVGVGTSPVGLVDDLRGG